MPVDLLGVRGEIEKNGPLLQYYYSDDRIFGFNFHNSLADSFFQWGKKNTDRILAMINEYQKKYAELCIVTDIEEKELVTDEYPNRDFHFIFYFDDLTDKYPYQLEDKLERILLNFLSKSIHLGKQIEVTLYDCYASNPSEMDFVLEAMLANKWIEHKSQFTNGTANLRISPTGWKKIYDIHSQREKSTQAFIAMWFDESMKDASQAIEKACIQTGFTPLRIDFKHHNNEISGEILYEIDRSKFLIADVTGQRQGVYFEAGYAKAKKMEVIWCCRIDELGEVHFDTRQYNHIFWETPEQLQEELIKRIKGTILS